MTFEWHSGVMPRAISITPTDRTTQKFRHFSVAECGPRFRFDTAFRAWLHDGAPKTLGNAANEWRRRNPPTGPKP